MPFRSDLQELRAIAVLLVIFAHLGVSWIAGGFVGVDVFFVLSGFLIGGLLLQEYEATGRLSLGAFYLRRLRRLLPALMFVLGVTSAVFLWVLPISDSGKILASLPFASTWTSNLYFSLGRQDYFDELAIKDVFLHTWSLGVEEQFYLIWPLLLLVLLSIFGTSRLSGKLLLLVTGAFFASVAWSFWNPISAFYMMPARIWQFGLGCLVYLYANDLRSGGGFPSIGKTRVLLSIGLVLILGSALVFDAKTLYPGFWALFPSLGAAFVILAGSLRPSSEFGLMGVGRPIFVWLGNRSYSLYLWHWPVIIFLGSMGFEVGSGREGIWLVVLLTLLLAMFSYRWIEQPFWRRSLKLLSPGVFVLGSAATVLFAIAIAFHTQRIASDVADPQVDVARSIRGDLPVIYRMPCDAWYQNSRVEPCVFGSPDAVNTVILFADSIGAQWFSALEQIYASQHSRLVVITKSACAIVDEDYYYDRIGKVYHVCSQWREAVLSKIKSFSPKLIIVGSAATYDFSDDQWVQGSRRVLERLSVDAEHVVVFSGTPQLGFDGPGCVARSLLASRSLDSEVCIGKLSTRNVDRVAHLLSTSAKDFSNVRVFNPVNLVCPEGKCRALSQAGIPVFRDSQHLTDTFVRSVSEILRKELPNIRPVE